MHNAVRQLAVVGGVSALALAAPGCGGDSEKRPATSAQARTHTVELGEYFYRPKRLVVERGDRVRFVNVDRIEHTVADSAADGKILSRAIKPRPLASRQSQTVTFRKAGTVNYLCTFHPALMRGVVVVR